MAEENDGVPTNPVEVLMARMDAHDKESDAIDEALAGLKLDKRKVNSIRATKKRLAKEQEMLDRLTGASA